jgi:hypothetical protein
MRWRNAVHAEVYAGTLTLQAAQAIISTDWFQSYKEQILNDLAGPRID